MRNGTRPPSRRASRGLVRRRQDGHRPRRGGQRRRHRHASRACTDRDRVVHEREHRVRRVAECGARGRRPARRKGAPPPASVTPFRPANRRFVSPRYQRRRANGLMRETHCDLCAMPVGQYSWLQEAGMAGARRMPDLDLLTVGDAAAMLGLSPDMVRVLHRQGRLRALRTPRGVRLFQRSDVEEPHPGAAKPAMSQR